MALKLPRLPKITIADIARALVGLLLAGVFLMHESENYEWRSLHQLELWAYDARIRLFLPKTLDTRVVILDIDEKSLNAEGRFPWPRDKMARLVNQLFERYKVAVVGFDVVNPEPDTSSGLPVLDAAAKGELRSDPEYLAFLKKARPALDYDQVFADELRKWPVVLGVAMGGETRSGVLPPPIFEAAALGDVEFPSHVAEGYSGNLQVLQDAAKVGGHIYPALDIDGTTRRVPMFMRHGDAYYEALSLAVARAYLGNAPVKIHLYPPVESGGKLLGWIKAIQIGEVSIPLASDMSALVPYRAEGGFRYVSATDVIRGTLPVEDLKDKIIIVGTSAAGLKDLRSTPVSENLPGVEIHANLVAGILDQSIRHRPPEVLGFTVLTLVLLGIPLALLLPKFSALWSTLTVMTIFVVALAVNLYFFQQGLVLPVTSLLLMLGILYFLNMAYGFFAEARSRALITGLFGTYVPKELVDEMAQNPGEYSMRGESREMTVLFSDVRDFTSISEGLSPEGLKDLMNAYLTAMTEKVQAKRGTIDKYIGDAIMAFWGAPVPDKDHALHALESAIEMQKGLRELDAPFAKRGWPELHIGVGLNCGMMSVGDMGSRFRRSYTVMGDSVNLASRLEALTKQYGVGILVTENIVKAVPTYVYREVDKVQVKGKLQGVAIFEPLGRQGEVPEERLREAEQLAKAIAAYRGQRWDEAENLFHAMTPTKISKLYLERIEHFRSNPPPADWDGVFVFTTK